MPSPGPSPGVPEYRERGATCPHPRPLSRSTGVPGEGSNMPSPPAPLPEYRERGATLGPWRRRMPSEPLESRGGQAGPAAKSAPGIVRPRLLKAAFVRALVMLRPDIQWKNPVMFVVEVGTVLSIVATVTKFIDPASTMAERGYLIALDIWLLLTRPVRQLRRGPGRSPRQGPGRHPAQDAPGYAGRSPPPQRHASRDRLLSPLKEGDKVDRRAGPADTRRRRDHRGRGVGGRVGHHRRIGPGDPRGRRRSLRRHRRHPRPVRPHRRPHHRRHRQVVPRSHDRAGRGGLAAAHAQRDRPVAGAVGVHPDLPDRHRHAVAVGAVQRAVHAEWRPAKPGHRHPDAGGAAGVPDPDDDRRLAGGDRHRRHGPGVAGEHHRQERQGGRGGRRRGHAAAGQDRHDHDGQPAGDAVRAAGGRVGGRGGPAGRAGVGGRSDAGGQEHRGPVPPFAGRAAVPGRTGQPAAPGHVHRVHGPDADERSRSARRPGHPQGGGRRGGQVCPAEERHVAAADAGASGGGGRPGRDAAPGLRGQPRPGHRGAGRHPQARHPRAFRPAAAHGPAHGDGHR